MHISALFLILTSFIATADTTVVAILDADNTLCRTDTLKMNENLVRILGFFGIYNMDMLTKMDYRGAPGTKTCFRQSIKSELEAAVPGLLFNSIYTPHDVPMLEKVPGWKMGKMYKEHMQPIEEGFLNLLQTDEFSFPLLTFVERIEKRSELYRQVRYEDPLSHWGKKAKAAHLNLNTLLKNNNEFYLSHFDIDWESATKGEAIVHIMQEKPNESLVIYVDDSLAERNYVKDGLSSLGIDHLMLEPPLMVNAFTQKNIYTSIGNFVFQIALKLKRLPDFSIEQYEVVLDLALQDKAFKNYSEATFLLCMLHQLVPAYANRTEQEILAILEITQRARQWDFLNVDMIEYDFPQLMSLINHWENLINRFETSHGQFIPPQNTFKVEEEVVNLEGGNRGNGKNWFRRFMARFFR